MILYGRTFLLPVVQRVWDRLFEFKISDYQTEFFLFLFLFRPSVLTRYLQIGSVIDSVFLSINETMFDVTCLNVRMMSNIYFVVKLKLFDPCFVVNLRDLFVFVSFRVIGTCCRKILGDFNFFLDYIKNIFYVNDFLFDVRLLKINVIKNFKHLIPTDRSKMSIYLKVLLWILIVVVIIVLVVIVVVVLLLLK